MTETGETGPVVVDTNVVGAGLFAPSGAVARIYAPHLRGRRLVVAYQTVGELWYVAEKRSWSTRRREELEQLLHKVAIARVDHRLALSYATLKHECQSNGHALGQKNHDGDRWIAATAIRYRIPLVSHDGIFIAAPGLTLITELDRT